MFDGLAEISTRVAQLQNALESPPPPPGATMGSAGANHKTSFAQSLQQAQSASSATHAFSAGTNGASQMPGDSGALPAGLAAMMGGGGGGLGALSGMGGSSGLTDGLAALGGSSSDSSGLQGLVGQIAQQQGVNPALAQAVAKAESGFDPKAVSPAGAQGLMQVMPSTFQAYAKSGDVPTGIPVQGGVSQQFGPTSFDHEPPLDWNGQHYAHFHTGVDLAADEGTPIRATMSGTVEIRSDPGGFGNLVVVRHGPWDILYGHTSGQPTGVQTGSTVRAGDVVGYVGSSGNSTGPHVHYEVRYGGRVIDPAPFMSHGQTSANPLDPVANAKAGVGYLKDMLSRFKNNVPAALAAYNAGPGAVDKYGGVPPYPETQAYVKKTMQYARDMGA
jgi:murein DD-endopeptidase MepM/ murein hydrolase activator NlpD